MKNKIILEQVKMITKREGEDNCERAQQLLLDHLNNYPKDTDAWLLLITIECNLILENAELISEYVNHILLYDSTNALALLFLAYAQYYLIGGIDEYAYLKSLSSRHQIHGKTSRH